MNGRWKVRNTGALCARKKTRIRITYTLGAAIYSGMEGYEQRGYERSSSAESSNIERTARQRGPSKRRFACQASTVEAASSDALPRGI